MTCKRVSAAQGTSTPWTREGHALYHYPRAAGIPHGGARQYNTVDAETQSLRHSEGCASTPWNPLRRRRAVRCRFPSATNRGIASSQSPLDSASSLRRKLRSLPCSSYSAAIRFAGFASEAGVVAPLHPNDVRSGERGEGEAQKATAAPGNLIPGRRPLRGAYPRSAHALKDAHSVLSQLLGQFVPQQPTFISFLVQKF